MTVGNLTLNTKTYTYSTDANGVIGWQESSGGIPTGFSHATSQLLPPRGAKNPAYRMEWRLSLPVVAASTDECMCTGEVLRSSTATFTVLFPPTSSVAERTDFALRLKDLVASSIFQNEIINAVRPV